MANFKVKIADARKSRLKIAAVRSTYPKAVCVKDVHVVVGWVELRFSREYE